MGVSKATALVSNADIVQTPQALYDDMWKREYGNITAARVYVHRLRKKLRTTPGQSVTDIGTTAT
jgi:DNA-binding response OmpR family regulator